MQQKVELDAWSLELHETMEKIFAPSGYKMDRIYGKIAVRQSLTKDTIDEAFFRSLIKTARFKNDIAKMLDGNMAETVSNVLKIARELDETPWYMFAKKADLRGRLHMAKLSRDLWQGFVVQFNVKGPSIDILKGNGKGV
jgi:hypothetical protein